MNGKQCGISTKYREYGINSNDIVLWRDERIKKNSVRFSDEETMNAFSVFSIWLECRIESHVV